MKRHFCTYFDHNYLIYGWSLFSSLEDFAGDFVLYVCCLDDACLQALTKLHHPRIVPIPLAAIEAADPEFAACRHNRTWIEYIFTLSPVFPLYLFNHFPEIDILGYLDSDLAFFASPEIAFTELGEKSILICPHNFAKNANAEADRYGQYNVAFQLYRHNATGLSCLNNWRQQCICWCHDRVEDGKFADQKYLDAWPEQYAETVVSMNPGLDLAPWNLGKYQYESIDGQLLVNGKPCVFFHFQGCKLISPNLLRPYCDRRRNLHKIKIAEDVLFPAYFRRLNHAVRFWKTRGIFWYPISQGRYPTINFPPFRWLVWSTRLPPKLQHQVHLYWNMRHGFLWYRGRRDFWQRGLQYHDDYRISIKGRPMFTIVTPCFNSSATIRKTLDSVLAQSFTDYEYIVVDGGSSDGTVDILKEYEPKFAGRMRYISEPDHGIYDAVAKGFRMGSGELLAWLGSDDLYFDYALETVHEIFSQYPEVRWLTGQICLVSERGVFFGATHSYPWRYLHFAAGTALFVQQETTFWRRELWEKAGNGFPNPYRYAGDYDLWTRFSRHTRLFSMPAQLAAFRMRSSGQVSAENYDRYLAEIQEISQKERMRLPIWLRLFIAIYKIAKSCPGIGILVRVLEKMQCNELLVFNRHQQKWQRLSETSDL